MIISSLLIALFSLYTISFVHAGQLSHDQDEQKVAILLNSGRHDFINSDDSEMLEIINKASTTTTRTLEEDARVYYLARMRGETPNTKINPNGFKPSCITNTDSEPFKYVPAPPKKERRAPTDTQLDVMTQKIWRHMLEASNTDFLITPKTLSAGQASTMQDLRQELLPDEIAIINEGLTQLVPQLHPTARELAAIAADILTTADEIADEDFDPSCYLQCEQEKLKQYLTPEKFAAFMGIYEEMARIKLPEDL